MPSIRQHVQDATSELKKMTLALERILELEGARNPKGMEWALINACCAASEFSKGLAPLRNRVHKQAEKLRANEMSRKVATK